MGWTRRKEISLKKFQDPFPEYSLPQLKGLQPKRHARLPCIGFCPSTHYNYISWQIFKHLWRCWNKFPCGRFISSLYIHSFTSIVSNLMHKNVLVNCLSVLPFTVAGTDIQFQLKSLDERSPRKSILPMQYLECRRVYTASHLPSKDGKETACGKWLRSNWTF